MSGFETVAEKVARSQVETEFARAFEEQHGLRLVGPDQDAVETRRLTETPHLDRGLDVEERALADLIGCTVEELL